MDKWSKKRLKSSQTKNGKHKSDTRNETKESKKLLWSRFKTFFAKKSTTNSEKSFEKISVKQPNMMNSGATDLQKWSPPEDSEDSQKLNILIGPGRQVSTVVLSPTETGFQAVVAHYEDNAKLSESVSKDITNVSEIKNRRTLTLVFNMDQGKFREIGVGNNESGEEYDERRRNGTNISMSEIYMRNNADQLMESTTLIQAQLPFEDLKTEESSTLSAEPKNFDLEKKPPSCKSIRKAQVALKTLSEPMPVDKHALHEDLIVKQNVEEMLNHIIFLERDPSLMGYVGEYSELGQAELTTIYGEQQLTMPVSEVTASNSSQYGRANSLTKFLQTTSVSSRTVAPDLLVNIKPFKEYIRGEKTEKVNQMDDRESMNHPTVLRTKERNVELPLMDKSRPPPCLKCGLEQKSSEQISSSCTTQSSKGPRTLPLANNDPCNLCSVRKTYRKSNLSSLEFVRDSLDDILKELHSYDHETNFRKNLSLFKSYLINQSDTKKSSSYLSVTEIIKLEGEKMTPKEVYDGIRDEHKIAFKCVETLSENGEKIIEFCSQERAIECLKFEALSKIPNNIIRVLENSTLFIFSPVTVKPKVMAQIVQEVRIQVCHFAKKIVISKECITVIPEAFLCRSKPSDGILSNRYSDKSYSEFQLYNKKPITDIINQLLRTKVEDLRNELLTRLDETKRSYERHLQEEEKIQRKCLTSGVCRGDHSQPFTQKTKDINFKPEVGSSGNWVRINDRLLEEQKEPVVFNKKENVELMEDKRTHTCAPVLIDSAKARCSSVIKPPPQEISIKTNAVMHSIPTLKDDAKCHTETTRSERELHKKKQSMGAEDRSEITKNQTRENVMNLVKDSKSSRKNMAMLENRDSINHFPNTSKGNLTTDDKKRKTEFGGGTHEETTNEILHRNDCASLLMVDDYEVRLLYYNRPKYQEACGSSITSNYSDSLRKDQKDSNSSTICDLALGEMDIDTYPKPASLETNKIADHNEKAKNVLNGKIDKPSLRPWETNLTNKVGEFEYDARDGIGAKSHLSLTENQEVRSTLRLEPVQKKPNKILMPHVKTFGEFADASGKGKEHFAQKEASPKGNTRRISVTVMLMKKWGDKTRSSIPTRCTSTVKSK